MPRQPSKILEIALANVGAKQRKIAVKEAKDNLKAATTALKDAQKKLKAAEKSKDKKEIKIAKAWHKSAVARVAEVTQLVNDLTA